VSTLTRATSAETTRGLRASLVAVHTFTLEIDDTDAGRPAAFAPHSAADASGRPTQQRGLQPMSPAVSPRITRSAETVASKTQPRGSGG
jgi:hypothetical protein